MQRYVCICLNFCVIIYLGLKSSNFLIYLWREIKLSSFISFENDNSQKSILNMVSKCYKNLPSSMKFKKSKFILLTLNSELNLGVNATFILKRELFTVHPFSSGVLQFVCFKRER